MKFRYIVEGEKVITCNFMIEKIIYSNILSPISVHVGFSSPRIDVKKTILMPKSEMLDRIGGLKKLRDQIDCQL